MRALERKRVEENAVASDGRILGSRLGRVVSARAGEVKVDFDGNRCGPLTARISAALDLATLEEAARARHEAVLLFEGGDPAKPLVLALLASPTPLTDAVLAGTLPAGEKVARVDGEQVVIEGREEIVLRCGKATLRLRRDGKIVLRGVNVIVHADELQKIRGGKVQIN
jgi:hypothetical protein